MDNIASHQDKKPKSSIAESIRPHATIRTTQAVNITSREIKKRDTANILPQREPMYVKQQLRLDYSRLLYMSEQQTLNLWHGSISIIRKALDNLSPTSP